MTPPTPLGALPSNQPVPTGLCQIKRGTPTTGTITLNNTFSVRPLEDGQGNPMRINITPARAGMWLIRAETIWMSPDQIWDYFHWGVRCVPADALGFADDRNHHAMHGALGWTESVINTAYQLNAGVAYYAEMYWPNSSSGYNQAYFSGQDYHYIMGEFLEGML
jgi:hypothetical protein